MAPFPFRNLGLKFLSICIAVMLWMIVGGQGVVERVLRAPVEYQNLPPAWNWSAASRKPSRFGCADPPDR